MALLEEMVDTLLNNPDKYERIAAAQHLAIFLEKPERILFKALNDPDPDVVNCIRKLLKDTDV